MIVYLYEHVDLSHGVMKFFESWNRPGIYLCCFQRGNLHEHANPGYHLDRVAGHIEGIHEHNNRLVVQIHKLTVRSTLGHAQANGNHTYMERVVCILTLHHPSITTSYFNRC